MKIHSIHHVAFEGLGSIESWSRQNNHLVSKTCPYLGQAFPPIEEVDLLLVMGGPMNIYEEKQYPWLVEEKKFLEKVIGKGRSVLGICLGAQLLADVLGGRVFANRHKEIGWFPIEATEFAGTSGVFASFPHSLLAFHWHGDTFEIPPGAKHIARSAACENQAFIYDERIVGLQFHLETTPASAEQLIANCAAEIVAAPYIQSAEAILADTRRFANINTAMNALLDGMR